jgi:membrane-associated protease RseP (regulator of RpoE activity)
MGPSWLRLPLLRPTISTETIPVTESRVQPQATEDPVIDPPLLVNLRPNSVSADAAHDSFPQGVCRQIETPSFTSASRITPNNAASTDENYSGPVWLGQWPRWLGFTYLAGAALLLGRWLLGYGALLRLLCNAEEASADISQLLREMSARAGADPAGAAPRLLLSRQVQTPFSCGICRPTVVIPVRLCEPGSEQALRWVFAHELTHLRRRDAWTCLLLALAQLVYWYVPWYWWLRRRVRLCQEYMADAAAAALTGPVEEYAQFLLRLAAAPRAPVGATGVVGHRSDLFRRVTMLLQNPVRVENRCPAFWSLATAGALLTAAVLVAGVGLSAQAAPPADKGDLVALVPVPEKNDDKKTEPKKDEPKKPEPGKAAPLPPTPPEIPLPPGLDKDQAAEFRKRIEMMRKEAEETLRRNQGQFQFGGFPGQDSGRLGVLAQTPSSTLIEQLDLPKGQGLVIDQVHENSPAAKAGLKPNDILLEFNGKPVPNSVHEFAAKLLDDIKPDTKVDVVVLRKGKKETLKGLVVPEKPKAPPGFAFPQGGVNIQLLPVLPPPGGLLPAPAPPRLPLPPPGSNVGGGFPAIGGGVVTSITRTDDEFTSRQQDGGLIITVTGKIDDGKARVGEISIHDGREAKKYAKTDEVPEQYRDKVKKLLDMTQKGSASAESKSEASAIQEKKEEKKDEKKDNKM